jgi:endonuclease III
MSTRPRPKAPLAPAKNAAATRRILEKLAEQHPGADTELHFSDAYQLLVATILSAQCTDERVNQVTPALFRRYPDARALARASTSELEPQIQSTGFFRAKSRSLKGMATALVDEHGGEVPRTMEALVKLPGVGRKTANVVLGHALGVPGLPVDRHVLRVANRIGLARSDDPVVVEEQLTKALPPADWTRASDTLILHGRRICKPRPLCDRCAVTEDCEYYRHVVSKDPPSPGGDRDATLRRGKPARRDARPSTPAPPLRGASKPRSDARVGGAQPQNAAPSSALPPVRRAAKPRSDARVGGAQPQNATPNSPLPPVRRAAQPRAEGLGGRAPREAITPSSPLPPVRRAAKPRGTGRGGGAPRQTDRRGAK